MVLAKDRNTPWREGDFMVVPVAANAVIYAGGITIEDAGYAKAGAIVAGASALGRSEEAVDNTGGSDGDKTVKVRRGVFQFANSSGNPVAQAHVGGNCYVEDDETVSSLATSPVAGKVIEVDDDGVWVDFSGGRSELEDLQTALASTANGEGASMVGIEDAGGYFGEEDEVEAALQVIGVAMLNLFLKIVQDDITGGTGGSTTASIAIDALKLINDEGQGGATLALQALDAVGGSLHGTATLGTATKGEFVSGENSNDAVVTCDENGEFECTLTNSADDLVHVTARLGGDDADDKLANINQADKSVTFAA